MAFPAGDRYIDTFTTIQNYVNTRMKEIQTKRMKKDYCIFNNKRVIKDNYKTLPYDIKDEVLFNTAEL